LRIAIHQPNYAPWCGYFTKIKCADVFIFLDDASMPGGQSYVYRTRVRNGNEAKWLSVPTSFSMGDRILDVRPALPKWQEKHMGTLRAVYGRSPFFKEAFAKIEPVYTAPTTHLASFNMALIRAVAEYLELETRFVVASDLKVDAMGDDRLIKLVGMAGGNVYLSGKGGENYQDPEKFAKAGIELCVREYRPVPYPQGTSQFLGGLSILDAIFNLGRGARDVLCYE